MFIVTNREINDRKRGLNKFGGKPNPEGANELRIVEAIKEGRDWKVYILPDELTDDDKQWLAHELHRHPQAAAKIEYERSHTGFCRTITCTAADIERLYQQKISGA